MEIQQSKCKDTDNICFSKNPVSSPVFKPELVLIWNPLTEVEVMSLKARTTQKMISVHGNNHPGYYPNGITTI